MKEVDKSNNDAVSIPGYVIKDAEADMDLLNDKEIQQGQGNAA